MKNTPKPPDHDDADAKPTAPNPGRVTQQLAQPMVPLQDDPPKPANPKVEQPMRGCWDNDGSVVLALHLRMATADGGKTGQLEFEMRALPRVFPDYEKIAQTLEDFSKGLRQQHAKMKPRVQLATAVPNLLGKKG